MYDYLIFRKKWGNSVADCRSYSSFSTVGSVNLRKSKAAKPNRIKTIDGKEVDIPNT